MGDANQTKLVVIGDGACGKTCMLVVQSKNEFPTDYVPTVFENYVTTLTIDGEKRDLALWDTAGQEDYAHIRPLSYADTNVFLLCFSIDTPDSFENIKQKWVPEMKQHCPKVPYFLVGCKGDMRAQGGKDLIPVEDCHALAAEIGAAAYMECSAKEMQNITAVFEAAYRAASQNGGCCTIL